MAVAIQTAVRPAPWRYQRGAREFQLLFSADHQSFGVVDPIVAALVVVPKVNKYAGEAEQEARPSIQFLDELANELVKLSRRGELCTSQRRRLPGSDRRPGTCETVVTGRLFSPGLACYHQREDQRGFI